ncbi:TetR/AcrR family transcriptional regulator [Kitasatospora sp. NPDC096147]|uniref:TetR/AcrR family transcriptional regulator n=1 Tax=Kitasatospora sp. NPDC096147 TaxID=3364093 RepID=UPI003809FB9C
MTDEQAAPRRRDARRNREALVAAASELFAEQGLDVPLDLIARRAGVGNATLYRHFPAREELIREVFATAGDGMLAAGEAALAEPDGWTGIERYFDGVFELVAANRGLNDLVTAAIPAVPAMMEISRRNAETVGALVERAQRQGTMRPDVLVMDLLFLLGPLCRAVPAAEAVRPGLWRRYLALQLDAFRARAEHPIAEPPVGTEQLDELFTGLWEAERP